MSKGLVGFALATHTTLEASTPSFEACSSSRSYMGFSPRSPSSLSGSAGEYRSGCRRVIEGALRAVFEEAILGVRREQARISGLAVRRAAGEKIKISSTPSRLPSLRAAEQAATDELAAARDALDRLQQNLPEVERDVRHAQHGVVGAINAVLALPAQKLLAHERKLDTELRLVRSALRALAERELYPLTAGDDYHEIIARNRAEAPLEAVRDRIAGLGVIRLLDVDETRRIDEAAASVHYRARIRDRVNGGNNTSFGHVTYKNFARGSFRSPNRLEV